MVSYKSNETLGDALPIPHPREFRSIRAAGGRSRVTDETNKLQVNLTQHHDNHRLNSLAALAGKLHSGDGGEDFDSHGERGRERVRRD